MRAVLDIALLELRILFNDRSIWINLVFIPIVLSVAVGYANGAGSTGAPSEGPLLPVDVFDNDDSALSQQFLANVREANPRIVLCPIDDSDACGLDDTSLTEELALERLENQTALALIEIPTGFEETVNAGEPATIAYRSNEDATAPSYILQAVRAAAQKLGGVQAAITVANDVTADLTFLQFEDETDRAAFEEQVRQQAQSLWTSDPITVNFVQASVEPTEQTGGEGFRQSIPGMASMYILFTVLPLSAAFIRERKQWTLQRLVTMPVSRAQILGGKLLSRFILGMIQFGVLFSFGLLIGARFGNNVPGLLLLMIAFTLCVTALALGLTTLLKNEGQAVGISLFLSLTLAPLGGAWWPLDIVPEWMRNIGHISPIAWVMDGFRSLIFFNGDLSTIIVPVLVLLALTVVFFTFGVLRFRFD